MPLHLMDDKSAVAFVPIREVVSSEKTAEAKCGVTTLGTRAPARAGVGPTPGGGGQRVGV